MNKTLVSGCALAALAVMAAPAMAADVYLIAKEFDKTLPGGTIVPMWGYALDAGGACHATGGVAADPACDGPAASLPGPQIDIPTIDAGLTIHLTNLLPESTSIVIAGQKNPVPLGAGPTWDDGSTGARGANMTKRVRSFGAEAPAGGTESYAWTAFDRTGTFVYHSGTSPQKQVYMGLYGAVTRDAAAGEVHAGVAYDQPITLFYSDIDPNHNASVVSLHDGVDTGDEYATSIHYQAQWFLINGEPYDSGANATIDAGVAGESTLIRFVSAASETHVPTLQGLYMDIHAEDGFVYNYQPGTSGDLAGANVPRTQYSVMMPPLKTKDAIVSAANGGSYAVYDGNGYMTNPSDPDVADPVGDELGGMLRFLAFAAPTTGTGTTFITNRTRKDLTAIPSGNRDAYYLNRMGTTTIPYSRGVLINDSSDTMTAQLASDPTRGMLDAFNDDGSFTYTIGSVRTGKVAEFTYVPMNGGVAGDPVTVVLRRNLSVKSASCAYDATANTCDWQVSGWVTRATPDGTPIEVRLGGSTGPLIGTFVKDGGRFDMTVTGSPVIAGSGTVIDVRAVGNPRAAIIEFPVNVSW